MATLIPAFGSCISRMTSGERRFAERLEQKLDEDYRIWYDVPIGPKRTYPDFVVLHPRRGILILETKDWRVETIQRATRQLFDIIPDGQAKTVMNPLAQARHCAIQVINALERDPQLIEAEGNHQGKLRFPWGYGVVFTRITRAQFEASGLAEVVEPHLAICSDEMLENADAERFQQRLWHMFPHAFGSAMSLPQLDRVRWIMFPEVRVPVQGALMPDLEPEARLPDLMQVMDLQQEQLARSLGDGHRVIHGVAGSGKTMILGYRAEQLAKSSAQGAKPILLLCFNEPLAVQLHALFEAKGLSAQVAVAHFHKWCRQQLVSFGQDLPAENSRDFFDSLVSRVVQAVDRGQIPRGQYQAILIDEGHDFRPEWLKLITQMVDPVTNSLLLLYDDAQSIYEHRHSQQFSFKSVGIQAQGRTTILRINYRNTRQILETANAVAADLLTPEDKDEDGIPLLRPLSCGRDGEPPLLVRLPTPRDEAERIAELLKSAHQEGYAWGDMAILCRDWDTIDGCADALRARRIPTQIRKRSGHFKPAIDAVRLMTMKVSKGLEFSVVALPGVGHMAGPGQDERDAARLFYVAATRATRRLIITGSHDGPFTQRLGI